MEKEKSGKFCAVNNTEIMFFNEEKLPLILPINKITSNFVTKEIKNLTTKTNLTIKEYLFETPVYIHSINNTTNKVSLNKVKSIIYYDGLKELYRIKPYLLKSFDITKKNCIIDENQNISNLDLQNISNTSLIKNNKYFGKRIDELELDKLNLDLSMDLGFIFGQWYSRGYIDRSIKSNPRFTWVALSEDAYGLLSLINKYFKTGIFHRSKIDEEKYDYIQIIDSEFNDDLIDLFVSNKNFCNWIYSAPYKFLNGLIYGIFFTNGTITFNKDKTKAYMTVKFLSHTLADRFGDLLNIKYNLQGTLSLVPDKKYCKISFQLNKSFIKIIENAFDYGYINNQNKKGLLNEAKENVTFPDYNNELYSKYNFSLQKISLHEGYNFRVFNSSSFSLLNGIMVPSLV